MGDLEQDTEVRPRGDGSFDATLSGDWEIWGPMGGYVASVALRAAARTRDDEALAPATFSCHFLGAAKFEAIELAVTTRKRARSALSQRVEVSQDGRAILDAMVWSTLPNEGLEHDETEMPAVPGPEALADIRARVPEEAAPPFPFWCNLDAKPIG